ncbi:MAG: DUF2225 domain-containing protein [Planctomycetes bacterium]|nr:DUF2225 domain-containing protein [Planctomycetota bacterium]
MEQRETLLRKVLEMVFVESGTVERFLAYAAERKLEFPDLLQFHHLEDFHYRLQSEQRAIQANGGKNNSLIGKQFTCGFHDDATPFTTHLLRPNTQRVDENEYLVKFSIGATKNQDPVNIISVAVQICPQCYFASTAEQHFIVKSPTSDKTFELWNPSPKTIRAVLDGRPERTAIARRGNALFASHRSLEDAIVAYELANASMRSIYASSPERYGHYILIIAENQLASAQLARELHDPAREEAFLRDALESLKSGEVHGKGAAKYRSLYRIVKLALHYHDLTTATKTASVLVQMKQRVTSGRLRIPDKEQKWLMRYAAMCLEARSDYLAQQGQPQTEVPDNPDAEPAAAAPPSPPPAGAAAPTPPASAQA